MSETNFPTRKKIVIGVLEMRKEKENKQMWKRGKYEIQKINKNENLS
jgi:hypothetical protein